MEAKVNGCEWPWKIRTYVEKFYKRHYYVATPVKTPEGYACFISVLSKMTRPPYENFQFAENVETVRLN
jgi:hypothetical protein